MAVTNEGPVPYTPIGQMMEIIKRYRDRGNPQVFDADSLGRLGVPESLIPRTLQSLKILDLVNDVGEPTKTFETIRLAPQAEYEKSLQDWVNSAYADVIAIIDPSVDDETRIRDAFRSYKPAGQQGRMVSLFIGLCEESGIRKKTEKKKDSGFRATIKKQAARKRTQTRKHNPGSGIDELSGLPAALTGLLHSLPDNGQGWSQEQRDKFYATFGTILDFCYPIVIDEEINND